VPQFVSVDDWQFVLVLQSLCNCAFSCQQQGSLLNEQLDSEQGQQDTCADSSGQSDLPPQPATFSNSSKDGTVIATDTQAGRTATAMC
jgi:hypothetical protein